MDSPVLLLPVLLLAAPAPAPARCSRSCSLSFTCSCWFPCSCSSWFSRSYSLSLLLLLPLAHLSCAQTLPQLRSNPPAHSLSCIQNLSLLLFPAFKPSRSCTLLLLLLKYSAPALTPAHRSHSYSCIQKLPLLLTAPAPAPHCCSTPSRPPALNPCSPAPARPPLLHLRSNPAPTKQLPSCAQPLLLPNSRPPALNLYSLLLVAFLHAAPARRSS